MFSCHQLKLRSKVSTEQEKLLAEKGREMEEIRKSLAETQSSLRMKENEVCAHYGILSLFQRLQSCICPSALMLL